MEMMNASESSSRRGRTATGLLLPFLHPDVIPLVLGYEATILCELQRIYGGSCGPEDGQLCGPTTLLLHVDELFVVDRRNHRIQVFHQGTGRFLRKWGEKGKRTGQLMYPQNIAVGLPTRGQDGELDGHEAEIFITDRFCVQIYRLCDSQFLRRFPFPVENGFPSWCAGIVVLGDDILISHSWPNQIQVLAKSDGKRVRKIGCDLDLGQSGLKLHLAGEEKELLLVDSAQDLISVLDLSSGRLLRQFEAFPGKDKLKHSGPRAVALHGEEMIVGCSHTPSLVVFDRSTTEMLRSFSFEMGGTSCVPFDLAVSSLNELFVCDSVRHRVLIFQ